MTEQRPTPGHGTLVPVPIRLGRRTLEVVTWLLLAGLLVQVYLAGLFLMGGENVRTAHQALGYSLGFLPPLVMLILGLIARMPWRFWGVLVVLFLLLHIQPAFTYVSAVDGMGWVRALHPLGGVALIALAYWQARIVRGASTAP